MRRGMTWSAVDLGVFRVSEFVFLLPFTRFAVFFLSAFRRLY